MTRQIIDLRNCAIKGRILDIGGGGEGTIARCFGDNVVVIDIRREELEESPDVGIKIVMDAANLMFLDDSFDNLTCFYSLMYMTADNLTRFLTDAKRVLKPGGALWIWDTEMPEADCGIVYANLDVILPTERFTVDYGVGWHRAQSDKSLCQMCVDAGLNFVRIIKTEQHFTMKFIK